MCVCVETRLCKAIMILNQILEINPFDAILREIVRQHLLPEESLRECITSVTIRSVKVNRLKAKSSNVNNRDIRDNKFTWPYLLYFIYAVQTLRCFMMMLWYDWHNYSLIHGFFFNLKNGRVMNSVGFFLALVQLLIRELMLMFQLVNVVIYLLILAQNELMTLSLLKMTLLKNLRYE